MVCIPGHKGLPYLVLTAHFEAASDVGCDGVTWLDRNRLLWLSGDVVRVVELRNDGNWSVLSTRTLVAPASAWWSARGWRPLVAIGKRAFLLRDDGGLESAASLTCVDDITAIAAAATGVVLGLADGSVVTAGYGGPVEQQRCPQTGRQVIGAGVFPYDRPTSLFVLDERMLWWGNYAGNAPLSAIDLPDVRSPLSCLFVRDDGHVWVGTKATFDPYPGDEPCVEKIRGNPPVVESHYRIWGDSKFWPDVGVVCLDIDRDYAAFGMRIDFRDEDPGGLIWVNQHGKGYLGRDYGEIVDCLPVTALALRPGGGIAVARRLDTRVVLDGFVLSD